MAMYKGCRNCKYPFRRKSARCTLCLADWPSEWELKEERGW